MHPLTPDPPKFYPGNSASYIHPVIHLLLQAPTHRLHLNHLSTPLFLHLFLHHPNSQSRNSSTHSGKMHPPSITDAITHHFFTQPSSRSLIQSPNYLVTKCITTWYKLGTAVDVGGTKTNNKVTHSPSIHQYLTDEHPFIYPPCRAPPLWAQNWSLGGFQGDSKR